MIENIFRGLFDTDMTSVISVSDFLLCIGISLVIGLILAFAYMYRSRYTKSFIVTLALLPAVVCVVIMMVNGNVGAGVAVAGAFSLVRFRSVPGTAREIGALYNLLDFGTKKNAEIYKTLNITIPEDLDYSGVFDEILKKYTTSWELVRVKTTNMGSMFRLTYNLTLRDVTQEKEMIDKLRCRNGNLEITVSKQETAVAEL